MRGQRHAPAAFYPRERPGIHCTGGWVGPRAGLDGGKTRPTGIFLTALYLVVIRVQEAHRQLLFMALGWILVCGAGKDLAV